jgi:hypothetical protein
LDDVEAHLIAKIAHQLDELGMGLDKAAMRALLAVFWLPKVKVSRL